jgi:glycosyltransferase involved in cell wall biosynthesis
VQRSISVLLPVKDAQATLSDSVHEILDWLADFTARFEVLIIDNGSTDATSEVAHELARDYPQIRTVFHRTPLGREEAIRSGLSRSRGDMVMVRDDRDGFRVIAQRRPTPQPASSRPVRPNYLNRLKSLTPDR